MRAGNFVIARTMAEVPHSKWQLLSTSFFSGADPSQHRSAYRRNSRVQHFPFRP